MLLAVHQMQNIFQWLIRFVFFIYIFFASLSLKANINLYSWVASEVEEKRKYCPYYFVEKHINSFSCFEYF